MIFLIRTTLAALLIGSLVPTISNAQGEGLGIVQLAPGEVKFAANPAQPGGPETAVLAGDPKKPGLYTIRVKFPANYKVQPHWHPEDRMSVVISGTLHFGYGDTFEETKLKELPPGSFFTEPSKQPHFVWAKSGEVVVQVSGVGPTGTTFVSSGGEQKKLTVLTLRATGLAYRFPWRSCGAAGANRCALPQLIEHLLRV